MKKHIYILWLSIITVFTVGCSEDEGLQEVSIAAPSNVEAKVTLSQDNSGNVEVLPSAENANTFFIDYGDGSPVSDTLSSGETFSHIYSEGNFDLIIVALNVSGKTTKLIKPVEISFLPPENLEVVIENDNIQSKTVNVTVNADFASSFEVDFGEDGNDSILIGNIEETVSFTYQEVGFYTITLVVSGSSSESTTFVEEGFEVTEVLQPVVAAPTPTTPAPNVIAIYSDAYTPITVNEFPTEWSNTGFEEIQVEGDNIVKYSNLAFTGIVTDYENPTNLTNMDFVHFDYWSTDATALSFKLVNTALNPVQEDIESAGSIVLGEWVSVDIPLDDFDMDRSQVTQLLFDTLGNLSTVFIDNIYFYTDAPTEPLLPAPEPTVDAANVISIYSDTYTSITTTEFPTPWSGSGFEEVQIEGNNTIRYFDLDFTGIVTDYDNPTDLTAMTHLHFDYWTPDAQGLGIKLVNTALDPLQEDLASVGDVSLGQWVSVDIPLADFDMDRSQVTQLIFDNLVEDDASITVYIDNFYFYN